MKIFALETNHRKIIDMFCGKDEKVVLITYYHGLSFFFAILNEILTTIILFVIGLTAWRLNWPMSWTVLFLFAGWFIFIFWSLIRAYIDWLYDFIIVTSDKVVTVDQTSFFRQRIQPIHVDSIGSVSTDTQFWNIFPFGIVKIHLKEHGKEDTIILKYVPRHKEVAAKISHAVSYFQRYVEGKQDDRPPDFNYRGY